MVKYSFRLGFYTYYCMQHHKRKDAFHKQGAGILPHGIGDRKEVANGV
jgi:hypothetical protein